MSANRTQNRANQRSKSTTFILNSKIISNFQILDCAARCFYVFKFLALRAVAVFNLWIWLFGYLVSLRTHSVRPYF